MNHFTCDHSGQTFTTTPPITLKGFLRRNDGRILLPEPHHEKHFAHRTAFLVWMKEALEQEGFTITDPTPHVRHFSSTPNKVEAGASSPAS